MWNYVALLIAIIGIMGSGIFKRWADLKERQMEPAARVAGAQGVRYAAKIERLEAHVAVLNRIVTDRGHDLAAQIDILRGPAAALQRTGN